ncbi:pyrroloquinoline quinone biosynthesis peptide chaperone PqqD [Ciceribacter sp. RN22]|uniref:pyrroloquinoline quinone biosynthesis peptide chaperone PqqD n=1 Tax=Ciceribacter sp. RN22 TaxID=2954932 RepID=UPI002092C85A|nr:pyrroloquinoline quinone biosynthesis peptide chaperone PqqD [Ciceribacter sp. RN22]MCO6180582.1 pyrroloquinoline quinone biosynthesis peptide chaperone PqqD [Ciceribacter sp. RN22]
MTLVRERAVLSLSSRPMLKRYCRLQFDPVRDAWALLAPERVYWPNEVSLEILRLCNGQRSPRKIIECLAEQYETPAGDITADVETFLQEWADRLVVAL